MKALFTGGAGIIGKNLVAALKRRDDVRLTLFDVDTGTTIELLRARNEFAIISQGAVYDEK